MQIVKSLPPNWSKIVSYFPGVDPKRVVVTYGENIHHPGEGQMDEHLILHESIHGVQQRKMGVKKWWARYFVDPNFRVQEEAQAYQAQYVSYCNQEPDRNRRALFLHQLVQDFSGAGYGNCIGSVEARKLITWK